MVGTTRTAGCLLFPRGSLLWEDFYNERRFEDWREWGRGGRGGEGGGKEGAGLPGGAETESPLITGTCVDSPLSGRRLSLCPGLPGGGSDLASPTTGVAVCPPWWSSRTPPPPQLHAPPAAAPPLFSCKQNKVVIIHEVSDSRGWEWAVVVLSFPPVKVVIESRVCVASLISEWWLMYSYSRRSLNSYFHCTATLCTLSSPGLRYQLQSQQNIAIAYFKAGICKIYQRFPFFCSFYNSLFWLWSFLWTITKYTSLNTS